ncbi:MAG TPA: UbiX family flavin prenyltransferase [Nitrososphaerales archaeon]|nr:UbiX family flavin prenyltransferase [Nitrososphaerales archaeon]
MRLIVGISGGSGSIYGIRFLEVLRDLGIESHLIITKWGGITITYETDMKIEAVKRLASYTYSDDDLAARISSGSFLNDGMIIIPCSMKTIGGILSGNADSLLVRAADVTLKEARRLVLVPRETPLNKIHLRNLLSVAEAGAIVMPPMPAFYHNPKSIDDIVNHIVGKALDLFGVKHDLYKRWRTLEEPNDR